MKQALTRQLRRSFFVFSFVAFSGSSHDLSANEADRLPASVGALGDSMTAGALASFRRQEFFLPWVELALGFKALNYLLRGGDVAAVESRKLSWAAGYDVHRRVYTHSYRLTQIQKLKNQIPTYNAAVSGAESAEVPAQVANLNNWARKNLKKEFPDYVAMMIGPNDICADNTRGMSSVNDYYSNITRVVDEILSKGTQTKMMIGAVPDIESLRNVARKAPLHIGLTCEKLWKAIKLCPTLTIENDPHEREIIAQRVRDYNLVLQDVVQSRRQVFGDRIRLSMATYEEPFNANDLSVDCFHPGPEGQAKLADLTWKKSWWQTAWEKRKKEIEDAARKEHATRCRLAMRGNRGARRPPGC